MSDLKGGANIKLIHSSETAAEVAVKLHLKSYTFIMEKVEGTWKIFEIDLGPKTDVSLFADTLT